MKKTTMKLVEELTQAQGELEALKRDVYFIKLLRVDEIEKLQRLIDKDPDYISVKDLLNIFGSELKAPKKVEEGKNE